MLQRVLARILRAVSSRYNIDGNIPEIACRLGIFLFFAQYFSLAARCELPILKGVGCFSLKRAAHIDVPGGHFDLHLRGDLLL